MTTGRATITGPAIWVSGFVAVDAALFWSKVDQSDSHGCWLWTGRRNDRRGGYGEYRVVDVAGKVRICKAHRIALAQQLGRPLRDDELALHHCDNPPCVRPDHLYAGTQAQNVGDMINRGRAFVMGPLSVCSKGHAMSDENVFRGSKNERRCRACATDRHRKWDQERRNKDRDAYNERQRAKYARRKAAGHVQTRVKP